MSVGFSLRLQPPLSAVRTGTWHEAKEREKNAVQRCDYRDHPHREAVFQPLNGDLEIMFGDEIGQNILRQSLGMRLGCLAVEA